MKLGAILPWEEQQRPVDPPSIAYLASWKIIPSVYRSPE
jgi:hypothetical protein